MPDKDVFVQPKRVVIPGDEASITQGQRWASILCAHCYGEDFSGQLLVDDLTTRNVPALHLMSGEGGAGGEFINVNWVRALRRSVIRKAGRSSAGLSRLTTISATKTMAIWSCI